MTTAGSKRLKEEEEPTESNISQRGSDVPGEEEVGSSPTKSAGRDEELSVKTLTFPGKRIHVAVKENARGRFMKITEVSQGKNRMTLSLTIAKQMAEHMQKFIDAAAEHESKEKVPKEEPGEEEKAEDDSDDGEEQKEKKSHRGRQRKKVPTICSETIIDNTRRYFLDLLPSRANDSVFLRVVQSLSPGVRSSVAVPAAEGIEKLKQAFDEAIEQFWTEDEQSKTSMPDGRTIRVGNKSLFFDPGSNGRGEFIRLTESSGPRGNHRRSTVTIPAEAIAECSKILLEMHAEMSKQDELTDKLDKLEVAQDDKPTEQQPKAESS